MPLQVAVSQVLAGQGILWIAVHFEPGDLVKTADAPEVADTDASDVDAVGLDDKPEAAKPEDAKPDDKKDAKKKEKSQ